MLAGWEEIVMIDLEQEYCDIAEARMDWWATKKEETGSTEPKAILKAYNKDKKKSELKQKLKQDKLL